MIEKKKKEWNGSATMSPEDLILWGFVDGQTPWCSAWSPRHQPRSIGIHIHRIINWMIVYAIGICDSLVNHQVSSKIRNHIVASRTAWCFILTWPSSHEIVTYPPGEQFTLRPPVGLRPPRVPGPGTSAGTAAPWRGSCLEPFCPWHFQISVWQNMKNMKKMDLIFKRQKMTTDCISFSTQLTNTPVGRSCWCCCSWGRWGG